VLGNDVASSGGTAMPVTDNKLLVWFSATIEPGQRRRPYSTAEVSERGYRFGAGGNRLGFKGSQLAVSYVKANDRDRYAQQTRPFTPSKPRESGVLPAPQEPEMKG
jgi:hypothetical protein